MATSSREYPKVICVKSLVPNEKNSASYKGLAGVTLHIIGCHSTEETRVQNAAEDVAGNGPG